jgi:NAD(P)H-dependent FMN reductase
MALLAKPLAVIGAAMGQYGGAWAHDETRKSFGIAGADVVDAPAFSLPIDTLGGKPPRESHDVVASLNDVLTKLAAEAG